MASVVAFPAHPDDEVLHTGGTLARAAAHGHRTMIVLAADGLMDAVPKDGEAPRLVELRASATLLGVARVALLGYANSGHGKDLYPDPPDRARFVTTCRWDVLEVPRVSSGRRSATRSWPR